MKIEKRKPRIFESRSRNLLRRVTNSGEDSKTKPLAENYNYFNNVEQRHAFSRPCECRIPSEGTAAATAAAAAAVERRLRAKIQLGYVLLK